MNRNRTYYRVCLELTLDYKARFEALQQATGSRTMTEMLRKCVVLMEQVVQAQRNGERLSIGNKEIIVLC